MNKIKLEAFDIIGIKVRTTNENGQNGQDIGALWQKFMSENIVDKIPNKVSSDIYSIYTNYESDHTKPYDTILACKVSSLENIPEGMVGQHFDGGNFVKIVSKGDMTEGNMIYESWLEIWKMDLDRIYTADFEIYGEKAQNPKDAEVDIMIAVK